MVQSRIRHHHLKRLVSKREVAYIRTGSTNARLGPTGYVRIPEGQIHPYDAMSSGLQERREALSHQFVKHVRL